MATSENQYIAPVAFHPGETLAEKLKEMGMGPKEFAIRTDKPEKTISEIINGKSSITPDMAVQFESVTKIPAHFWLNKQRSYDEYLARKKRDSIIESSAEWTRKFPVTDMIKKGWLAVSNTMEEKTTALLSFFGVSSADAWNNYYLNQQLKVEFRISLAHTSEPYAISAWLRKGELQAAELSPNAYSELAFKKVLPKIKSLMAEQPDNFFEELQQLCLSAGVKIVYTPCLPKAPINGSTRWINGSPLIQLSGRYRRNDIFWFTFFHEAGHIILHGKKDIFLENVADYSDYNEEKEKEADDFAVKWTLTEEEEKEILQKGMFSEEDIVNFAKKFNTHPAIIIGRLQHNHLISYSTGKNFLKKIDLS